jgi:ketosteroid isomerase-like protein
MWSTVAILLSLLQPADNLAPLKAVLDDWHKAAADADEARYFSHFTADAVFLGTDATERWTRDEFRKWAAPYFARKKAWSFKATRRHLTLSKDGSIAWFDEELATPNLGPARGSGVLIKEGPDWKIAQYNLSVPIPNDVFSDVKKLIEEWERKKK